MTTPEDSSAEDARRRLHREAGEEWQNWYATLSPAHQRQLRKGRMTQKQAKDSLKVSGHSPHERGDAAELPQASVQFDFTELDHLQDHLQEIFDLTADQARRIAKWHSRALHEASEKTKARNLAQLAGPLISATNPKVTIAGLAYATNMAALNGLGSMREFSRNTGISPEAVSKKKREWERTLGLGPGVHGKSLKARRALSEAQTANHWRHQKYGKKK